MKNSFVFPQLTGQKNCFPDFSRIEIDHFLYIFPYSVGTLNNTAMWGLPATPTFFSMIGHSTWQLGETTQMHMLGNNESRSAQA